MWTKHRQLLELFEKDDVTLIVISLSVVDCWVFKFLWHSVDGKHLMSLQSDTSVFKFLRNSVDWALIIV